MQTLVCYIALGSTSPPLSDMRRAGPARRVPCGRLLVGAEALQSTAARKQSKKAPQPIKLAGQLRDAVLTADVVFKLFDDELLLGNNRLDKIAN